MNDWYGTAKSILASLHESLPADIGLHERHQACIRAKPHEFASTSWGQKTWARAQREYLVRYGYVPKNAPVPIKGQEMQPMLSPLEKAAKRGREHTALLELTRQLNRVD